MFYIRIVFQLPDLNVIECCFTHPNVLRLYCYVYYKLGFP
jgi:hypothetical protein